MADPLQGDRTLFIPSQDTPTTLPDHPFFNRLLRFAHAQPPRLCVRDVNANGREYTHAQLLTDALAFRTRILASVDAGVRDALAKGQEVYLCVLCAGGYEYCVAIVAALACGAAVVPMTTALPPEEAVYFATKSRAAAILCGDSAVSLGTAVEKLIKEHDPRSTFSCVPVRPSIHNPALPPHEIKMSGGLYLSDNAPGVVIFTSGTTGPPKGAVMRRGFMHDTALALADHYALGPSDTLLHILPVHHATGIGVNFFPCLMSGAVIEFRSGSFSAEWTWERLRRGGITIFSGVPTIYMRMQRYYEQKLASQPDVGAYVSGARALKASLCGTSALPKPIADFWAGILGKKIVLRYGATEFGAVVKAPLYDQNVPDGSVGTLFPGYEVRLRNPDTGADDDVEGEVLVKGPAGELFSKYIWDPAATAAAHSADGFFRTGDIARREGEYFWILGRASIDIIKSGGYKISALDIEREILGLPYVAEVMVVGVPDLEFGERVAAVLSLKLPEDQTAAVKEGKGEAVTQLSIDRLRQDLRARLAGYKMPTVLRVIEGELPKSATNKVVKKVLRPVFFPEGKYATLKEVQMWSPKAKL